MLAGHFISTQYGKLFVTQFGNVVNDTAILCLPSIVEELNLCRAVVAKQAQNFAKNNIACFVLDYFGTGDSEGEFEQANCDIWLENILSAGEWLQQQGVKNIILWGVRFGGLFMLAHQVKLHKKLPIKQQILWKPVTNGKQFAGQFLRIKQANAMLNKNSEKVNWRQFILAGNNTEVAGYLITAEMLTSMESMSINDETQPQSHINWLELAASEPTPLTKRITSGWDDNKITIQCFESLPFWQVPEIFSLPVLNTINLESILKGNIHE